MKKLLLVGILCLVLGWFIRAQTGSVQYFAPSAGTTITNCGTPTTGFPLCGVATGWFVWNGTAWVQLGGAVVTGVTSITVGTGTKQTGDVVLPKIPTGIVFNPVTPSGALQ
jgi:hypothetical protein